MRSAITGPLGIVIMQSNKKDTKPLSQMVERYTKNGFALRLVDVVYIPAIPFPYDQPIQITEGKFSLSGSRKANQN